MVKNIVNSAFMQNLFYNFMAVLFVGSIITMIIIEFAFELQEVGLAITYSILVLGVFWHLYNA